jgi:hypothetical protein
MTLGRILLHPGRRLSRYTSQGIARIDWDFQNRRPSPLRRRRHLDVNRINRVSAERTHWWASNDTTLAVSGPAN